MGSPVHIAFNKSRSRLYLLDPSEAAVSQSHDQCLHADPQLVPQ